MLEPLFRCNLACSGCGKIQHPVEILRQHLTPEQCFPRSTSAARRSSRFRAANRCCTRRSIRSSTGLIERKKFVYLCTNAMRLEASLDKFMPSPYYFGFNIHLDGPQHDPRQGRRARRHLRHRRRGDQGRQGARLPGLHQHDDLPRRRRPKTSTNSSTYVTNELKVDGMQISPGYRYEKAPDQDHFLAIERHAPLFREILAPYSAGKKKWEFNASPLLPRLPHRRQRLRLHAVGHAELQPLRLAEAVLSAW